jgi:hypothetical protein
MDPLWLRRLANRVDSVSTLHSVADVTVDRTVKMHKIARSVLCIR